MAGKMTHREVARPQIVYHPFEDLVTVRKETEARRDRRGDLDRFGPYVVVDSIATGGMAQVYKVRHESDPTKAFALKCIRPDCDDDPEFRRMLLDEARITGRLQHPNINRVLEVVRSDGRVALLLEHVEGLDLVGLKRHLRSRDQVLALPLALYVVREVLDALDFAHRAEGTNGVPLNIVHRDVSPGNVMVDIGGRVILIDFGIAHAQGRLSQTEVGSVKGKFRYMAPEQIKGATVGPSADIYAAGVMLWELLSGQRIHDDIPVAQLMMRVANAEVPTLASAREGLPDGLRDAFVRATALDPESRFETAAAFADALAPYLANHDLEDCQRKLAKYALQGSSADHRKSYTQAVARARVAAEHDLEGAILDALEEPDRVERVDVQSIPRAEATDPAIDDEDETEFDAPGPLQFGADPPTVPITRPELPVDSE